MAQRRGQSWSLTRQRSGSRTTTSTSLLTEVVAKLCGIPARPSAQAREHGQNQSIPGKCSGARGERLRRDDALASVCRDEHDGVALIERACDLVAGMG